MTTRTTELTAVASLRATANLPPSHRHTAVRLYRPYSQRPIVSDWGANPVGAHTAVTAVLVPLPFRPRFRGHGATEVRAAFLPRPPAGRPRRPRRTPLRARRVPVAPSRAIARTGPKVCAIDGLVMWTALHLPVELIRVDPLPCTCGSQSTCFSVGFADINILTLETACTSRGSFTCHCDHATFGDAKVQ